MYIYICTPRCETNMNVKRPVPTYQTSISSMLNNMIRKNGLSESLKMES